jgi:hypothetical protein
MTAIGVAAVAWNMAAAASGSSRNSSTDRKLKEKPLDSSGFFAFPNPADGRENPAALLDIGGSLC